jgi:hypothetical protein
MSMAYIRKAYGVPAKRGQRVRYAPDGCKPREGVIVGSCGARLRIRIGDDKRAGRFHPTWALEYLDR